MVSLVSAPLPSRSRPPPDPPPCKFSPLDYLPPVAPEPPDPPGAFLVLLLHRLLNAFHNLLRQELFQTLDLEFLFLFWKNQSSGVNASLVPMVNSCFVYEYFVPAVCSSLHHRRVEKPPLRPYHGPPTLRLFSLIHDYSCSFTLPDYSSIESCTERYRVLLGRLVLDLWTSDLNGNVPMDLISFGSPFVLFNGIPIASMRPFTAVCRFLMVFNMDFGIVILCSFWCQVKKELIIKFPLLNLVASYLEQFPFPIFSHVLSKLDEQALLVLQGSSFQLMLFSALVAEFVTFRVTLDASLKEAYEIFDIRFFMVSFCEMYLHSIISLVVLYAWALRGLVVLFVGV